jgi:hypothetical protein
VTSTRSATRSRVQIAGGMGYIGPMNPNIIEIIDDPSVRMSTSLKLSEGLRPLRVVLRELPEKFVTHIELMTIAVETRVEEGHTYDYVVCRHDGFDQGHYFEFGELVGRSREEAIQQAHEDFNKRATRY